MFFQLKKNRFLGINQLEVSSTGPVLSAGTAIVLARSLKLNQNHFIKILYFVLKIIDLW